MEITFWFDPSCPFTWRTSRWVRDVAARHDYDVRWQFLSLAMLNEGRHDIPERLRQAHQRALRALRVLAAADQRFGQQAVDRLYTELGQRVHEGPHRLTPEVLTEALSAAGLPADLSTAADDPALDKLIRESHDAAQANVGTETGSPVTSVGDGRAFFGPVLTSVPSAADADRVFGALRLLGAVPQFSELKGAREPLS
jgi:2-hydroxychromene-2-carboxylate isomerase